MKKRVPGFRVFAVKTVLMLAALSVQGPTLRASSELDAYPEVYGKLKAEPGVSSPSLVSQWAFLDFEHFPAIVKYLTAALSSSSAGLPERQ